MVEKILVREYLSSLKEDGELDYIFVFLLESMGFEIITTPRHSKGQPQYGKDVVAVGEFKGKKYCWNFELKGFSDRDVDSYSFNKKDGVLESLREIKGVAYENRAIPDFDKLPIKVVLVHNGIIKENFKKQFNEFIKKEFKKGEFEDWDIYRLTDLFYGQLFNEYLLSDERNAYSFRRLLMFLDVPDYNFEDLAVLFTNIIEEYKEKPNDRQHLKLFSTLNILIMVILNYARQKNNLIPAKYCVNYIVLNTWEFLLFNDFEKSKKLKIGFNELLKTQILFYNEYFAKTWEVAGYINGLFEPTGLDFESISYPIRAFEYADDLIYFFQLSMAFASQEEQENLKKDQKRKLRILIENNKKAFHNPILDNHFITIFHIIDFILDYNYRNDEDVLFSKHYINECLNKIILRKQLKKVFPYHGSNLESLVTMEVTGEKQEHYPDTSSLLIPFLLELTVVFSSTDFYEGYKSFFEKGVSLQTAIPNFKDYPDFENRFFKGNLHTEYDIEFRSKLPQTIQEFREILNTNKGDKELFRTEKTGYGFLMTLGRSFYKNEPFPNDWRCWIGEE